MGSWKKLYMGDHSKSVRMDVTIYSNKHEPLAPPVEARGAFVGSTKTSANSAPAPTIVNNEPERKRTRTRTHSMMKASDQKVRRLMDTGYFDSFHSHISDKHLIGLFHAMNKQRMKQYMAKYHPTIWKQSKGCVKNVSRESFCASSRMKNKARRTSYRNKADTFAESTFESRERKKAYIIAKHSECVRLIMTLRGYAVKHVSSNDTQVLALQSSTTRKSTLPPIIRFLEDLILFLKSLPSFNYTFLGVLKLFLKVRKNSWSSLLRELNSSATETYVKMVLNVTRGNTDEIIDDAVLNSVDAGVDDLIEAANNISIDSTPSRSKMVLKNIDSIINLSGAYKYKETFGCDPMKVLGLSSSGFCHYLENIMRKYRTHQVHHIPGQKFRIDLGMKFNILDLNFSGNRKLGVLFQLLPYRVLSQTENYTLTNVPNYSGEHLQGFSVDLQILTNDEIDALPKPQESLMKSKTSRLLSWLLKKDEVVNKVRISSCVTPDKKSWYISMKRIHDNNNNTQLTYVDVFTRI